MRGNFFADDFCGFFAVHDRHVQIHQHGVKFFAFQQDGVHRLLAIVGDDDSDPLLFKQSACDNLIEFVVFNQQNGEVAQIDIVFSHVVIAGKFFFGRQAEGYFNPEAAALARRAFDADAPAHAGGQMLADREAEAVDARCRRGSGAARGWPEQGGLLFFREPDAGVDDGDFRGDAIGIARDRSHVQRHRPVRRVFDGVADKIIQNLRHAHRIAGDTGWKSGIDRHLKLQAFFKRHCAENALHVFGDIEHAKRRFVEYQMPGFDFGKIEHAAHRAH